MQTLVEQLQSDLNISEEEAKKIIETISNYVENQHPLLKDISEEILEKEIQKIKNV